ncbi:MAG: penicillin-binding protein, partial [Lewinella sp.]|nr:penicillin-binding protein [Lewinella sp.]
MTNWRATLASWRDQLQDWILKRWQLILDWARAQPRWRLVLYGVGGPALAALVFTLFMALLVWQGVLGPLPSYGELTDIHNDQASEIISADGALLGKYYIENRTDADVDEIATVVIDALVATEDARFFEHSGFDLRAFGRVLFKSILLADRSSGGGSTLSQQLAKNLFPRRSYWLFSTLINKMREIFTARRLENLYTKEELLALYLNTVPFGENAFGIKVAAHRFFNTTPENLAPEEAAVLVGMLKGTSYYNPRRNPERAMERRNLVLAQMVRYGKLDTMAVDSLQALPLELDYQPEGHNEGLATYFREHLRQEVLDILEAHPKPDGTPYNLYRDGLKIFTTIDSRLQSRAEAAVAREMPDIQA